MERLREGWEGWDYATANDKLWPVGLLVLSWNISFTLCTTYLFFLQEKARRAREEGHEDEIDDNDLLMKEKAMLFSDYHQPYHFLSKEKDTQAASNRREQPGSSRPSPPRRSRRPAMDQDGSDV